MFQHISESQLFQHCQPRHNCLPLGSITSISIAQQLLWGHVRFDSVRRWFPGGNGWPTKFDFGKQGGKSCRDKLGWCLWWGARRSSSIIPGSGGCMWDIPTKFNRIRVWKWQGSKACAVVGTAASKCFTVFGFWMECPWPLKTCDYCYCMYWMLCWMCGLQG